MMGFYTKRPVTIEARQTGQCYDEDCSILAWCGGMHYHPDAIEGTDVLFFIPTLEGEMEVTTGDWVIRGVAGEFYPCKPAIFEQTYEPAKGSS